MQTKSLILAPFFPFPTIDSFNRTVKSHAVTIIIVLMMNYTKIKSLLHMIVLRLVILLTNHRKQRPQRESKVEPQRHNCHHQQPTLFHQLQQQRQPQPINNQTARRQSGRSNDNLEINDYETTPISTVLIEILANGILQNILINNQLLLFENRK
jgi:hypothetical protein